MTKPSFFVWQTYALGLHFCCQHRFFATALAEPALLAVALKAEEISGGAIRPWGLRIAVAIGVGFGLALGTFRIVTGMGFIILLSVVMSYSDDTNPVRTLK